MSRAMLKVDKKLRLRGIRAMHRTLVLALL